MPEVFHKKRGITCSLVKKGSEHGAASGTQIPQDPAAPSRPPQTENRATTDGGFSLDPVQMIGMMSVRGEPKEQGVSEDYVEHLREILWTQGPEEAMRQLLLDNRSSSLSLLRQSGGQFETFAEEHAKTYIEVFHEAWPFLHAATLDVLKDNLQLASSVITIGILLKKDAVEISRSEALACHELMMDQFFRRLTESPRGSTIEPWPMEWYQAVLLNIIIGTIRNELPRSQLLCSLFIAHLRLVGFFDSAVAEAQTKIYHPGTFLPFVLSTIEQRSRLIAYLFKADALLSLLDDQPLMLHAEELDTRLPQTFALWNALRGWKYQLTGIQRMCSTSDATTGEDGANALRLIRAYRGDDDAKPTEEWQQLARNRATNRVREAMKLHDVLESSLHNCSQDPNNIITGSCDIGMRHTLLQSLDMGP
ncbi:C6 and C2H2 transcription factor [Apiospora phragmitis]|uniref:C6 and C2H2 transcription factor n=1 Tax=Apiospora phragmitis TaxID=2905665 RepID=A0ABR1USL7_9PEZI